MGIVSSLNKEVGEHYSGDFITFIPGRQAANAD